MDGFQRRKEQKMNNILEAALSLFMEFGVQKVSIAEIAKKAKVSQVTIYNYFESKDKLVNEVIVHYVDKIWYEYDQLLKSDLPFEEKIKEIIFKKTEGVSNVHEDLYQHIMKEYTSGRNYLEQFYTEKALPMMYTLFNEGKEKGYIDPNLSTEAIFFYVQMFKEFLQKEEVYLKILPYTEDITKLFFYGIVGNRKSKDELK